MSELKTRKNNGSVTAFLESVSNEEKRKDSFAILKIFKKITKQKPIMWGSSIVGFGQYHYKSERSRQEGDWMMVGFSPRKNALTLYLMFGLDENNELLAKLGKHKRSVGCLYINKLSDIDIKVLEKLIDKSYKLVKNKYSNSIGSFEPS